MHRCAMVLALLVGTSALVHAGTQMDLAVSGQTQVAVIDANDNGMLGDSGDCTFGATTDVSGNLVVTPNQSSMATNPLRVCQGPCTGFGSLQSGLASATISDCDWDNLSPGAPFVPACMVFGPSVPSSQDSVCSNSDTSPGTAQQANGDQVEVKAARLFYPGFEFLIPDPGFGFLCNAGGPAVEITTISGRRVITDLTFVGDPPTHVCVKMPFELVNGSKKLLDACLPLTRAGNIDYEVEGGEPFANTPLTGLPSCGLRNAAPAASDLGLVAIGLLLLGFGAWKLGGRRGFSASLPLL